MTIGVAIFLIFIIYLIDKHSLWRLVLKITGGMFVFLVGVSLVLWLDQVRVEKLRAECTAKGRTYDAAYGKCAIPEWHGFNFKPVDPFAALGAIPAPPPCPPPPPPGFVVRGPHLPCVVPVPKGATFGAPVQEAAPAASVPPLPNNGLTFTLDEPINRMKIYCTKTGEYLGYYSYTTYSGTERVGGWKYQSGGYSNNPEFDTEKNLKKWILVNVSCPRQR